MPTALKQLVVLALMIALLGCGFILGKADAQVVPPEDSVTTVTEAPPVTTVSVPTTTTRPGKPPSAGCTPTTGLGRPTTTETYNLG